MLSQASRMLLVGLMVLAPGLLAGQTPASAPTRPNVVVILVESLRGDHLGCYGYQRKTSPNMDRLASEGVVCETCYSPASWTVPSVASILTGLMPRVHGVVHDGTTLPATIPTMAEAFKDAGYFCAAVISNPLIRGKCGFGRGFDTFDDYSIPLGMNGDVMSTNTPGRQDATVVNTPSGAAVTRQAQVLLQRAKELGKPFFLLVFYFDPHADYVPPAPYDTMFDRAYSGRITGTGIDAMRDSPPPARDMEHLVALYDGEIAYVDEQIGELLKSLGTSREPAKTLIVVAGDHGEAFGEHGKMHHANSAHEEEVRVPMIWCWPGFLSKAYRVQRPVSTLDIAATLREATGAGKDQVTQGMSLWPALKGGSLTGNRQIIAEKASSIGSGQSELAVREGKWRLYARQEASSQPSPLLCSLYDLEKDPKEQKPIPLSEEPASASMEEGIDRFLSRSAQLRDYFGAGKEEGVAREERIELLRSLGYFSGKNAP